MPDREPDGFDSNAVGRPNVRNTESIVLDLFDLLQAVNRCCFCGVTSSGGLSLHRILAAGGLACPGRCRPRALKYHRERYCPDDFVKLLVANSDCSVGRADCEKQFRKKGIPLPLCRQLRKLEWQAQLEPAAL